MPRSGTEGESHRITESVVLFRLYCHPRATPLYWRYITHKPCATAGVCRFFLLRVGPDAIGNFREKSNGSHTDVVIASDVARVPTNFRVSAV